MRRAEERGPRTFPPTGGLARLSAFGLVVAVGLGIWARTRGLGVSPLANDEYYFVLSIQQILEHGVPRFETGGIYTRGLLVQYLTVPFMWLTGSAELGPRIPSVLFGLATVGVAWAYGRRVLGRRYALVLVVLLLLSSWHVEFSRFGRMYAGFQFVALAMFTALYDVLSGETGASRFVIRRWPALLVPAFCLVALFTHRLALALVPLMFLPLILPGAVDRMGGRARVGRYALAALAVASFAGIQDSIRPRDLGVANPLPEGFAPEAGGPYQLVYLPFWRLTEEPTVHMGIVLGVLVLVAAVGAWLVRKGRTDPPTVIASLLLVAAAAHLLLIAAVLALVLGLRYGVPWRGLAPRARARSSARRIFALAAVIGAAWIVYAGWVTYGLGSRAWIEAGGFELFRQAFVAAFVWPNPWPSVIFPWFRELPVLSVAVGLALAYQVIRGAKRPVAELVRTPGFLVLYVLAVFGLVEPEFNVTRYTYFAYPVVLALLVLSAGGAAAHLGARLDARAGGPPGRIGWIRDTVPLGAAAAFLVFGVSGDFDPRHLVGVDSPEAIYRMDGYAEHEVTWYPRDDFTTPAEYVEAVSGPDDAVLVVETPPASFYLHRPHLIYLDRRASRFENVSRAGGTIDFWTGRPLLSTPDEVRERTACTSRAWIIRMAGWTRWLDPATVWNGRLRAAAVVFEGRDAAVEVLEVALAPGDGCPSRGEESGAT